MLAEHEAQSVASAAALTDGITRSYFDDAARMPLVVSPSTPTDLADWAAANRSLIQAELDVHGAILFRGFGVSDAPALERVITATSGSPLPYMERSSPRSQVEGNIYTSTDYPSKQEIFLHNEQSYNTWFPLKIYFCCLKPADHGGETPIADCRRVYQRLRKETLDRFADGYVYVRNFGAGPGMSWRETFQTEDPRQVEAYCREHDIEMEWHGTELRTVQRRRAIAKHPRTGQPVWFNHLTFFHLTTLPAVIQEFLQAEFPQHLPNQTFHADRREIDPDVLDELRAAYRAETVAFRWEMGDVLMLDNMMVAHGRRPFGGSRKVVVGMAEECAWADV